MSRRTRHRCTGAAVPMWIAEGPGFMLFAPSLSRSACAEHLPDLIPTDTGVCNALALDKRFATDRRLPGMVGAAGIEPATLRLEI